jgi:hypothetical protein
MAVHTVRIESTSPWATLELQSAASWVRAPGYEMLFDSGPGGASVEITDRTVRITRNGNAIGQSVLCIQVATLEDRLTLHSEKLAEGVVIVTTEVDMRMNDSRSEERGRTRMTLYLERAVATG